MKWTIPENSSAAPDGEDSWKLDMNQSTRGFQSGLPGRPNSFASHQSQSKGDSATCNFSSQSKLNVSKERDRSESTLQVSLTSPSFMVTMSIRSGRPSGPEPIASPSASE